MSRRRNRDLDRAVWRPFVIASLGTAVAGGFGLGAALFLSAEFDASTGIWWLAAAQAHGHVQLFGWAGLMVLGVGFHFLPRLLGASLHRPGWTTGVLWLLLCGLVLRAISQPGVAIADPGRGRDLARIGLAASGVLELAGGSLAVWLLARTVISRPEMRTRDAVRLVLPFAAASLGGLWIALAINALALARVANAGRPLVASADDRVVAQIAFYLFLIPIAVTMATRTFPLYFRTPPPRNGLLRAGLALLVLGMLIRIISEDGQTANAIFAGHLAQALALVFFVVGLEVFSPRLPLPRRSNNPLHDPIQLHVLSAFGWLLVTVGLLLLRGSDALGAPGWRAPLDAEWHSLGAGFVTPLILGVGAHLLPGFARRPLRSSGLVWVTLGLVNAAALLRVGPLLAGDRLSPTLSRALTGSAGVIALAALVVFAVNLGIVQSTPGRRPVVEPATD